MVTFDSWDRCYELKTGLHFPRRPSGSSMSAPSLARLEIKSGLVRIGQAETSMRKVGVGDPRKRAFEIQARGELTVAVHGACWPCLSLSLRKSSAASGQVMDCGGTRPRVDSARRLCLGAGDRERKH
jgi:hypothetical protein